MTGAGGVLCSNFAKVLARAGAKVALLDINLEAAQKFADEINAEGGVAKAYACDVLNKETCYAVADAVEADLGKCDILLNGAGGNNPRATTDKEYYEDGDIDADGKVQAKNVKLHSDDGDVNFDDLRISSGKITSDDGDISVSNLLTRKGATVESDDGDIRIRKSNASGYRLTSDDGDVTFKGDTSDNDDGGSYYKNTKSSNLLSAHSDDGDVNVN